MIRDLWRIVREVASAQPDPAALIDAIAEALGARGIPQVRELPLTGFGQPDDWIDLFVEPGLAILIDTPASAPPLERVGRCARPPGVTAVGVLTTRSPCSFPTETGARELTGGKPLLVHALPANTS
ncbi:hypothetical protein [Longimicrobium terrae]|uniref:Uncharacterized protein n=1 Tax=Longimicrobium terrae TaxID=1639882 RepID=A0A841GRR0_9BACT|nr:hypothetical protein [Longimicrobium terrae]MBB4635926.1 hypothetical protein [Longimicrobium terrae]MBB6070322.1 hypothetical protein [Longimicrobium terrae]NNC30823.1 hypothetical protein [Longimicrobium terrae]